MSCRNSPVRQWRHYASRSRMERSRFPVWLARFPTPCRVMLVCAMNPCPCGYFGHQPRRCTCPPGAPARYLSRVSGPLLDRLDLHIEVPPVDFQQLSDTAKAEPSAAIRARVAKTRAVQERRLEGTGISCNAHMSSAQTRQFCRLTDDASFLLKKAFEQLGLSARAYDKVLRVARTIADMEEKRGNRAGTHRGSSAIQKPGSKILVGLTRQSAFLPPVAHKVKANFRCQPCQGLQLFPVFHGCFPVIRRHGE